LGLVYLPRPDALPLLSWKRHGQVVGVGTHVLVDGNGPVGTLTVSATGDPDKFGAQRFSWSITDAQDNVLGQDELVVEGHNRPDARKAMGRLIAQLIQTADQMSGFLDGNNYAFTAPFFEQPDVRSFALLHIEQLERAGKEFDSRDVGPIF
jgi:hypothetical protein